MTEPENPPEEERQPPLDVSEAEEVVTPPPGQGPQPEASEEPQEIVVEPHEQLPPPLQNTPPPGAPTEFATTGLQTSTISPEEEEELRAIEVEKLLAFRAKGSPTPLTPTPTEEPLTEEEPPPPPEGPTPEQQTPSDEEPLPPPETYEQPPEPEEEPVPPLPMIITIDRSGGVTSVQDSATIDTSRLLPAQAENVMSMVAAIDWAYPAVIPVDMTASYAQTTYDFEVVQGQDVKTTSMAYWQLRDEHVALIDEVFDLAYPEPVSAPASEPVLNPPPEAPVPEGLPVTEEDLQEPPEEPEVEEPPQELPQELEEPLAEGPDEVPPPPMEEIQAPPETPPYAY